MRKYDDDPTDLTIYSTQVTHYM